MTLPLLNVPPLPPLGGDVVTFVTLVLSGTPDAMGQVLPTLSAVDVPQCRHRPIPATTPAQRETPEDITDVGTQVWQTHAPPVAAALAFTNLATGTTGQLRCNGITYQVLGGAAPVTGADGQILFVKILSKVQVG